MDLLAGPYFACASLLVAAGALKAVRPQPTALALRSVGLAVPAAVVRVGGAAEALLGLAAVLRGGRLAAIGLAASYALFAAFVVVAMRRGGSVSSCGCFGRPDTPPTRSHVAVNVGAALLSALVAEEPVATLPDVLAAQPLAGVPFVMIIALCGWFGYLLLTLLPALHRRPAGA